MPIAAGIFRQYDIRGIVGHDLTTEAAHAIGDAYAAYMAEHSISAGDRRRPRQSAERSRRCAMRLSTA